MRKTFVLAAFAVSFLVSCAGTAVPVPQDPASLIANGQAVVVSRGFAFGSVLGADDVIQGSLIFSPVSGERSNFNVLSDAGGFATNTGLHRISVVPAGTYGLSFVQVGNASSSGRGGPDPLSLITFAPGSVTYLGDLEVRSVQTGRTIAPNIKVRDLAAEARAALAAQSAALAQQMTTRLMTCLVCSRS